MGKEAQTSVTIGGQEESCKVLLEGDVIIIRGALRRSYAMRDAKDLTASDGALRFTHGGERVRIELGADATKWLEALLNPRTRAQKLGIAAGMKVIALGTPEADAIAEVEAVIGGPVGRRVAKGAEVVLLFAPEPEALDRLEAISGSLAERGAVWVLWPKGRKDFSHEDVVAGGKRAGLTQTRSIGFSEKLTGLRFVRPAAGKASPGKKAR